MSRQQMHLGSTTKQQRTSYAGQATTAARGLYGRLQGSPALELRLRYAEESEHEPQMSQTSDRVWAARVQSDYVGLAPDEVDPEADERARTYLAGVTPIEDVDAEVVVLNEIRAQW